MLDEKIKKMLLLAQKNEITEHLIYQKLSTSLKDPYNKSVLKKISNDELKHYHIWKKFTSQDVQPSKWRIWKYFLISKLFGLTFGIKLMEKGEGHAKLTYAIIAKIIPEAEAILRDEGMHEKQLIALINEEKLRYIGSMVLGLNDALVELTAALAGFTLALQNTRIIALTGLVTGIAGTLSMAASEYLSTKTEEGEDKHPLKASLYTGTAYVITVLLLITPYLVFDNYYLCLGVTMATATAIIAAFTFYISVAQEVIFKKKFIEMACISFAIALLSFGIGYVVRLGLGIDV